MDAAKHDECPSAWFLPKRKSRPCSRHAPCVIAMNECATAPIPPKRLDPTYMATVRNCPCMHHAQHSLPVSQDTQNTDLHGCDIYSSLQILGMLASEGRPLVSTIPPTPSTPIDHVPGTEPVQLPCCSVARSIHEGGASGAVQSVARLISWGNRNCD